jgi:hypothetical protein
VQCISEKSQTIGATEAMLVKESLQANVTDVLVTMFGNAMRNSNATQPMR